MKVYRQCLKEWAGWFAQEGVPNSAVAVLILADYLVYLFRVGLAWHTVGIYHTAISTFWNLIIATMLPIIPSL